MCLSSKIFYNEGKKLALETTNANNKIKSISTPFGYNCT